MFVCGRVVGVGKEVCKGRKSNVLRAQEAASES
jgi:hypothetical protein